MPRGTCLTLGRPTLGPSPITPPREPLKHTVYGMVGGIEHLWIYDNPAQAVAEFERARTGAAIVEVKEDESRKSARSYKYGSGVPGGRCTYCLRRATNCFHLGSHVAAAKPFSLVIHGPEAEVYSCFLLTLRMVGVGRVLHNLGA